MNSMTLRQRQLLLVFSGWMSTFASAPLAALDRPPAGAASAAQPSGSAVAPSEPPYRLDVRKSRFFVEAEAGGVLAAFAHDHKFQVRNFSGTVSLSSHSPPSGSLDLSIVADSLTLVDKVSDDDRKEIEGTMKQKVLETSKFPKISFRSAGVTVDSSAEATSQLKIVGNLWLHGVGHKITFPVTVVLAGDGLRATGTVKLRQTDYGMTPVTAAIGTIRVKDEVTISFDLVAAR
jgi:polyisoprenoid-binding protein YceI